MNHFAVKYVIIIEMTLFYNYSEVPISLVMSYVEE
jgi:hypothetical protein